MYFSQIIKKSLTYFQVWISFSFLIKNEMWEKSRYGLVLTACSRSNPIIRLGFARWVCHHKMCTKFVGILSNAGISASFYSTSIFLQKSVHDFWSETLWENRIFRNDPSLQCMLTYLYFVSCVTLICTNSLPRLLFPFWNTKNERIKKGYTDWATSARARGLRM